MTRYFPLGQLFSPHIWVLLASISLASLTLAIMQITHVLDRGTYVYVIQPVLVVIGVVVAWWLTRGRQSRLRGQQEKTMLLVSIMTLWIIGFFLTGIVVTYVQNPLMGSFRSVVLNTTIYGVVWIGLEYIRYRIVLSAGRRNLSKSGFVVIVSFALFQASSFVPLLLNSGIEELIKLSVSVILPIIIYNFVQTYLAYTAGLGPMIAYATGWLIMNVLLPITPHYDWYMTGMMSLCLGLLTVFMLDRTRQDRKRPLRFTHRHGTWVGNGIFFLGIVGLICLMTGVFSYKPLVIMSNSMVPVYSRGDMIFVERVTQQMDIRVGDIIEYKREDRVITHRVVKIVDSPSGQIYTAKGDNNHDNDPWPIARSQIKGLVKARIPYIGYPSVVINELIQQKR